MYKNRMLKYVNHNTYQRLHVAEEAALECLLFSFLVYKENFSIDFV